MHLKQAGQKLDSDGMKSLSQEYWSLDPAEYENLRRLGSDATALHAAGVTNYPIHSERAAFARSGNSGTLPRESDMASGTDTQIDTMISHITDGQGVPAPEMGQGEDLKKDYKNMLKECAHRFAAQNSKFQTEVRDKLADLLSSHDHHNILQSRRRLREIVGAKWSHLPHTCPGMASMFSPQDVAPRSTSAPSSEAPVLRLAEGWRQRHVAVRDGDKAFVDPGVQRRPCHAAHHCICRGEGKIRHSIAQRLKACVTKVCLDEAIAEKFTEGRVAIEWVGSVAFEDAVAGASTEAKAEATQVTAFTHLSLLYQKPWRATLTSIIAANEAVEDELTNLPCIGNPLSAEHLSKCLPFWVQNHQGRVTCLTLYQHLLDFDLAKPLSCRFWELSSRSTPTSDLTTAHLHLLNHPGEVLWKGLADERAKVAAGKSVNARTVLEETSCKHSLRRSCLGWGKTMLQRRSQS